MKKYYIMPMLMLGAPAFATQEAQLADAAKRFYDEVGSILEKKNNSSKLSHDLRDEVYSFVGNYQNSLAVEEGGKIIYDANPEIFEKFPEILNRVVEAKDNESLKTLKRWYDKMYSRITTEGGRTIDREFDSKYRDWDEVDRAMQ